MYTPLYVKTDYSLLSSLIKIDKLILRLKELKITSCSIVDDNLFGTMEFITKCSKENIKPIIGLDLNLNDNHILLYAKDLNGYYNLVKLESLKSDKELTLNDIENYKDNLIAICFDQDLFATLQQIFVKDDLFYGVSNSYEEDIVFTKNIVYVNKTLYLKNYEYKYLPYIFMIRDGKTISDGISFTYQDNDLKCIDDIKKLVSQTALNNTLKISDRCNVVFKKELFMPKYDTLDSKEFLISLANKGLNKRLNGNVLANYQERLDYELKTIIDMHFEDYFLVVYDYIRYAKVNNILVGPGRGSAAGSLVCYSLGITEIDPIKYDLLFERFLNPERITMPDIDTDFPDSERDKVINYVKEKYGNKKVAGIITFGTLKSKQAIRDVGRVLNIRMEDIDYLCQKIKNNESLLSLKKRSIEISNYIENDDKLKLLYNIVLLIENNKRHTSIHAAGIVISYKNLDEVIPIYKNDDLYLTEYSMEYLEQLGLIKMDFLGLRNLTIIKNILNDIKQEEQITISFNKIPLDDPKVFNIFKKGDTTGIFQFESEGMKRFLKELDPNSFTDISNALALYRPGPALNIPTFINRKKGIEKDYKILPALKNVLEDTYGIIVYQEQIMKIANIMANYTLSEADLLRRAMSKKKLDILKQEEDKFINNSISNGYSYETSKEVYDLILRFANYGFNKSHSVSYATIAFKMAYLKTYFPKYFYSNLLESVVGSEIKTNEYLNEVKKLGIKILPPDVNYSYETKYRVTKEGIRLPLSSIRNVGEVIAKLIVLERNKKEFTDIYDFLTRTYSKTNNTKVLESLIYAHALDSFNYNITTLIKNMDIITNYVELGENLVLKPEITYYEDDIDEILEQEHKLFGFYLTSHKTEKYKLQYKGITDINMINNYFNKSVNLIGIIDKVKEVVTKNNSKMLFLTVSDSTGSISVTVFPKKYQEISNMELKKGVIILINGKVEKRFDEYQIILDKIKIC